MDLTKLSELAKVLPTGTPESLIPTRDLHIDGDYAAYYYSGRDDTSIGAARKNMLDAFRVVKQIGQVGGKVYVHLTAPGSAKGGRYKVATVKPYQGQRDGARKPKNWDAMRSFLESGLPGTDYEVVIWHDREADDGVAHYAKLAHENFRTPVIFSRDKDFRMIPGVHVVWTTYDIVNLQPKQFNVVGPDLEVYGEKWFWLQMLQGDTADNIPGLEKVQGPKKATNCGPVCALDALGNALDSEEAFEIVDQMYEDYYGDTYADRFAEQAALLWMRNDHDALVTNFLYLIPDYSPVHQAAMRLSTRVYAPHS